MDHLPTFDLAVIVAYFAAVVGLGLWLGRKATTTDQFMAAGRSLPGWAVGLSMFGSYISSLSFLANAGKAYGKNWNAFVFSLMTPLAAAIAVVWLVPFYRRTGHVSAYEHLEHRFGPWARAYSVVCFLLLQMARTGAIIYLLALAISPLLGWNVLTTILVTGVIMTVYTILGGIVAVVWTGVLQSAVLIAGTLTCLIAVIVKTPGGLSEIVRVGAAEGKFGLGTFGDSTAAASAEPTFWVVLAYGILMNLANFAIDQSYIQRYITARNDREAKKSVWLTTGLYMPVAAIFFFIGTALFVFYSNRPELLGPVSKADEVFPFFISHELPMGMAGLVIAALFAASMDSNLNSMATLTYCDLYQRYLRPQASEREGIVVLRVATLAWGAVCTAVGVSLIQAESILDAWWQLAGLFSAGMLGLFWLGFLSRRATSRDAALAVVVGMVVIVWATLSPTKYWPEQWQAIRNPMHGFLTVVVVVIMILVVGMASAAVRRLGDSGRKNA
jgi:solute:Na+ symporter, SSS family